MLVEGIFFMKFHIVDTTITASNPETRADHAAFLLFPRTQNRMIGDTM